MRVEYQCNDYTARIINTRPLYSERRRDNDDPAS